jgi:hypothetical protein
MQLVLCRLIKLENISQNCYLFFYSHRNSPQDVSDFIKKKNSFSNKLIHRLFKHLSMKQVADGIKILI